MNARYLFLIFSVLISSKVMHSQIKVVSGEIYDIVTNEPIPYATIVVFNHSAFVEGTSSDSSGNFKLVLSDPSTVIRIGSIGYKESEIQVSNSKSQEFISIGLESNHELLEEVIITEPRTIYELRFDKKIINLNSDIQNAGVSVLEALDQITEVDIDFVDNRISLRGHDNVQILINGKPSPLAATEILNQLNSSSIDHIEIMTSPSAKYRSNGISGILNFITKKENSNGFNLKTHSSWGTRRYGLGASGNYASANVNYRLNASRSYRAETNIQNINRQFDHGFSESIFTPYNFRGGVNMVNSGIDIFLKDKHELSFGIDYTNDDHSYNNKSSFTNPTGQLTSTYLRENEHHHNTNIFSSNYRLKLGEEFHFLEFDYQVNVSLNKYPFEDFLNDVLSQEQFLTENFTIHSTAIDYSFAINDSSIVEAGLFYNTQKLDSQVKNFKGNSSFEDQFDYDELVHGGYGLYHTTFKSLQVQAGLRFEYFRSISKFSSVSTETNRSFQNLFPSLHLSYTLDNDQKLTLGYAHRVTRPNFHHTNAFQLVSPLYDWQYNPNIIPEISHNIELNFQKYHDKWNIGISSFYRIRKDVILWTALAEDSRQIFRYINSGTFQTYGLELTFKYRFFDNWTTVLSSIYYVHSINPDIEVTWRKNYSSRINLKNTLKLKNNYIVDLVYIQLPKGQTPFSIVENRTRFDLSMKKSFTEGRLSISLKIVDILNQNVIKRQTKTKGLIQDTEWELQNQRRSFLISLNYQLFDESIKARNEKTRKYNQPLID